LRGEKKISLQKSTSAVRIVHDSMIYAMLHCKFENSMSHENSIVNMLPPLYWNRKGVSQYGSIPVLLCRCCGWRGVSLCHQVVGRRPINR